MVVVARIIYENPSDYRMLTDLDKIVDVSILWVYKTVDEACHKGSGLNEEALTERGFKELSGGKVGINMDFKFEQSSYYGSGWYKGTVEYFENVSNLIKQKLRERQINDLLTFKEDE